MSGECEVCDEFKLYGLTAAECEKRLDKLGVDGCTVVGDGADIKVAFTYDKKDAAIYGDIEQRFLIEFSSEVYALRDVTLKEQLVDLLKINGIVMSAAESFTGGGLSAAVTSVPGASKVFYEGIVAYSEIAKNRRLGVRKETLEKYKPVSAETAAEMAEGLLKTGCTDIGVSTTGIAGPSSDDSGFPVGLCFIGVSYMGETEVYRYEFAGDRATIVRKGIDSAMFRAIKFITRGVIR